MVVKRSAMKAQLEKRLKEQQEAKDRGLNDYESYFNVPEGMHQFMVKPTPDGVDVGFDIIPFIAGGNYPTNGYNINEDDLAYVLDVWVHRNVGPTNKPVVCPMKNYGKSCPLCEKRDKMQAEAGRMEKEEYKQFRKDNTELFPSRRVIYNAIMRQDEKEEAKGIQILEQSHFFFENKFQEAAKRPRGGGIIPYPDPDDGKTVWLNLKKNGDNWEVGVPVFEDRDYIIEDAEIEAAAQLDQIIKVYSYDEILNMVNLGGSGDDCEEEEEVEQPLINRRTLKKEEETVEEQEEVEEEEEAEVYDSCPYGAEFGVDYDEFNECDSCDANDDCKLKKEEIEAEKKAAEESAGKKKAPARRKRLVK